MDDLKRCKIRVLNFHVLFTTHKSRQNTPEPGAWDIFMMFAETKILRAVVKYAITRETNEQTRFPLLFVPFPQTHKIFFRSNLRLVVCYLKQLKIHSLTKVNNRCATFLYHVYFIQDLLFIYLFLRDCACIVHTRKSENQELVVGKLKLFSKIAWKFFQCQL